MIYSRASETPRAHNLSHLSRVCERKIDVDVIKVHFALLRCPQIGFRGQIRNRGNANKISRFTSSTKNFP